MNLINPYLARIARFLSILSIPAQGPESQCLLKVTEDLSIDFSGCEK